METKSRAREIGCCIDSRDLANFNTAIIGAPSPDSDFILFTAFLNITDTGYWVALIENLMKTDMKVSIFPIVEKSVLNQQGAMAYNIGAMTNIAVSSSSPTITFGTTVANAYYILSVYASEAFYLDSSEEFTVINNPQAIDETTGLAAGAHTLMVKAADTSMSITFKKVDDGNAPAGLAVTAYAVTAWSPDQCRGII